MSEFSLPSFAKINWHLRVFGKRDDGYHELCTVFQTVSLADQIHFAAAENLSLTCDQKFVPTDERNLIIQAARLLREHFEIKSGAKIHLEKNIPAPGGLGGGSSNAAVALLGLSKLWNLEIDLPVLIDLGKKLGADVPFFFYGGTAIGSGRGTEIEIAGEIEERFLIIVTPPIQISTALAFKGLAATTLTNERAKSILVDCRRELADFGIRQADLINDFERSVFSDALEIKRAKETLLELGATRALMSGSGASVFGIFDKQETRQAALKALEVEQTWRRFAVATVSRGEYFDALRLNKQFASD